MSERSKDKMRPSLVRASDLRPREPADKAIATRGPHGHFGPGNPTGKDARFIHTVKKSMGTGSGDGTGTGDAEAHIVARDARRVAAHVLRAFPSAAAPVRVLVSIHARHVALHAYFTVKAEEAGLTTPAGLKLLEVADRQSQRAERVLVSAQDIARVCAVQEAKRAQPVDAHASLVAALTEEPAG